MVLMVFNDSHFMHKWSCWNGILQLDKVKVRMHKKKQCIIHTSEFKRSLLWFEIPVAQTKIQSFAFRGHTQGRMS